MQATLSIFPSTKRALESTKIPFVVYTQPIPEDLPSIENDKIQVPRCPNPNCTAFFNGLCSYNSRGWTCSVCGQHTDFKANTVINSNNNENNNKININNNTKNNINKNTNFLTNNKTDENQMILQNNSIINSFITSTPNFQIVDPAVTFPLTHVIIIGCGDITPARSIMQSLPPDSPVIVFVMNTAETARKLVTTAGNLSHLSKLPKDSFRVPIVTVVPLLLTLLNAKKSCFWCRVFCAGISGNTFDEKKGKNVIEKLRQFDRIPIRIDFFIDSPIDHSISTFSESVPGVVRFFPHQFSNLATLNNATDIASSDCARPFGFQCKVIVKCGPHFKASCDYQDKSTLSVIASSRAVVPFKVEPSIKDPKLKFQAVQVLAHVHIWDPPTNTLKKCTNVLNCDFPVSSDINTLISSSSSSALFDYLARHDQLHNVEKVAKISDFENLKALNEMRLRVGSSKEEKRRFESLAPEFFQLCPPTTWRFVLGTFVETWNVKDSNEVAVIIVKKFPNVYFALKEGVDVLLGDAVRKFVELCKPLQVNVEMYSFDQINSEFKDEIAASASSK